MNSSIPSKTSQSPQVSLVAATHEDTARIEAMMQFYNYDLSEWYPVVLSSSGLYKLRPKEDYWRQPGVRPFLIRVDDELAGFAVVDDEVMDPQADHNMGYFFVARRYRGRAVGRCFTQQLFRKFPGRWEIDRLAKKYRCRSLLVKT